jgi:MFS family permease
VDEVSTSLHNEMVNEVTLDLFTNQLGIAEATGLKNFSLMEMLANIFLVIGFFYKTLADRYGRKPFLIANTLGMAGGLASLLLESQSRHLHHRLLRHSFLCHAR